MNPAKQENLNSVVTPQPDDLTMKMLGALVPEEVFWKFKAAALDRKEQMQQAITHAALMYIDARPEPASQKGDS